MKFLNFLYILLCFLIPFLLLVIYANNFAIVATESSIGYLNRYLDRLQANVDSNFEFGRNLIILFVAIPIYKFLNEKANKRELILGVKSYGDWVVQLWNLGKVAAMWFILWILADFFKINSDKIFEVANTIIILVISGIIIKLYVTYKYWYKQNKA